MENDTSNCSVRSFSQKNQKIFDQYMNQIAPIQNKENLFLAANSENRLNYHQRSALNTPDKTTRSNSQIQVIQALQKKVQEQRNEIESLKDQLKPQFLQQQNSNELARLYQELQEQFMELSSRYARELEALKKQQYLIQDLKAEKESQIEQMKRFHKQQIEEQKIQQQLQLDRYRSIEGSNEEKEKMLLETLEELRRERLATNKLKLDFREQLNENEKEYEKQISYQQKLYQELKQHVQQLQSEKLEQQSEFESQINYLKCEKEKHLKNFSSLKQFFEQQMKVVEEDVSKAIHELKQRNQELMIQKSSLEDALEMQNLENKSLMQMLEQKQQDYQNLVEHFEQLLMSNNQLKQLNETLSNQLSSQLHELSNKLELERNIETTGQLFQDEIIQNSQDRIKNQISSLKTTTEHLVGIDGDEKMESQPLQDSTTLQSERSIQYKLLLSQIIEVEKEAYRLNSQYQMLFQQFSKVGAEGPKSVIKQEMTSLMTLIRENNSRLYELKAKEFTYLM